MHTEQVWSNWSLRQQNYLNYRTFTEYFVITSFSYYYFNYFWHVAMLQKFCRSSCGGPLGRTCWTCLNLPPGSWATMERMCAAVQASGLQSTETTWPRAIVVSSVQSAFFSRLSPRSPKEDLSHNWSRRLSHWYTNSVNASNITGSIMSTAVKLMR